MVVLEVGIGEGERSVLFSSFCKVVSYGWHAELNILSSFLLDDK